MVVEEVMNLKRRGEEAVRTGGRRDLGEERAEHTNDGELLGVHIRGRGGGGGGLLWLLLWWL